MSWARPVAGSLALLLALAWAAPPAAAGEVQANPSKSPLSAAAAAQVAKMKPTPRAFQTPTGAPGESDSRSFLRSRTGVIAAIVMAAGLGYTVYSAKKDNDPVESPIR
jgi:hypothetical protein